MAYDVTGQLHERGMCYLSGMRKILPLFFAALLGLASCSKSSDDAQPNTQVAGLVGRWQGVSTRAVETTPSGQTASDQTQTFSTGSYSVDITTTEFVVYSGSVVDKRNTYTKVGNVLQLSGTPGTNLTIQEQTATRLVLTNPTTPTVNQNNTAVRTTIYAR
jgi:hypothetical protein